MKSIENNITQKKSQSNDDDDLKTVSDSKISKYVGDWKPGTILVKNYEIKKILGKGGMGTVYLMVLKNFENVKFAVKTLKSNLVNDTNRRQNFIRELRTWIDLPDYPHLVACRFFRTIDDRLSIFSEFVEGGSLKNWIRQGQIKNLEQILDIGIQSAWGLHIAHENGVIHQDVKPENILMTPDGIAKISDFGLSRARKIDGEVSLTDPEQQSILVSTGGMTLAYCSPEQANGKKLSRKTDIWSLGVSILEMFTGGIVWKFGFTAGQLLESFRKYPEKDLNVPIPKQIIQILNKCFHEISGNRWASMKQLADSMIALYSELIGKKYPRTQPQNPIVVSKSVSTHDSSFEWDDPVLWYQRALELLGESDGNTDQIKSDTEGSHTSRDIISLEIFEETEKIFNRIKLRGLMDIDDELSELYLNKSLLLWHMDDMPGAIETMHKAIDIMNNRLRETKSENRSVMLSKYYIQTGVFYYKTGDYTKGIEYQDKALASLQSLPENFQLHEKKFIECKIAGNKAMMMRLMGNIAKSQKIESEILATLKNLIKQHGHYEYSESLATVLLNQGNTLALLQNYPAAIEHYEECRLIREQLVYQDGITDIEKTLPVLYMNLANSYRYIPNYPKAIEMYDKSEQLERHLIKDSRHPKLSVHLAMNYGNQALMYSWMDKYERSSELHDKSIEIFEVLVMKYGRTDLIEFLIRNYINHGFFLNNIKNYEKAFHRYDQAFTILDRFSETGDPTQIEIYRSQISFNKGQTLLNMNRPKDALKLIETAERVVSHLVHSKKRKDLEVPLSTIYHTQSKTHMILENYEMALTFVDKSIAIRKELYYSWNQIYILENLVSSYELKTKTLKSLNRIEDARFSIRDLIGILEESITKETHPKLQEILSQIKTEYSEFIDH